MSEVEYTLSLNDLYDDTDPKSIERYAQRLLGHTFNEVGSWNLPSQVGEAEVNYGNKARKGGLGNFLEERFFGYKANSDSGADFSKAGVELKVSPYEKRNNGKLSAGERLVLTMISYDEAVEQDFYKSHLWAKCSLLLLIYYLRDRQKASNMDYRIDYAKLFTPPKQDLDIILQDYKIIIDKISSGKAHELSESDTMYLGACTKGATAEKSTVPQWYYAKDVKAMRRAFCFKQPYMTYVLNNYIVPGKDTYEPIIKDINELKDKSFEDFLKSKIQKYVGKTDKELCELFDREYNNNKSQWVHLAHLMLGIKSNKAEEFEKAKIVVKSICLEEDGRLVENSPLPNLCFKELIKEDWEDSELCRYLDETKFFIVVWQKKGDIRVLKGCQLWNMPRKDMDGIVYKEWKAIRDVVRDGVVLTKNGNIINNNFPKKKDSTAIHIRPHTQKTYYDLGDGEIHGNGTISNSDELPDGRRMTKQSFWLNNTYLLDQLDEDLKK